VFGNARSYRATTWDSLPYWTKPLRGSVNLLTSATISLVFLPDSLSTIDVRRDGRGPPQPQVSWSAETKKESSMSTLRTQMTHDRIVRGFTKATQKSSLRAVTDLAQCAHRRPDQLSDRDVQRSMVH